MNDQQTLTKFLNSLRAGNKSTHTTIAYQTDLVQFFAYLSETDITVTHPAAITRNHVIEYLANLQPRHRVSCKPSTAWTLRCHQSAETCLDPRVL